MIKTKYGKNGMNYTMYKNMIVSYKRVKNDINGNPLYRVYPINFIFRKSNKAYKNYEKPNAIGESSYYLLQSYNINLSIESLLENILIKYKLNIPVIDKELLKDWHDVITLNDKN